MARQYSFILTEQDLSEGKRLRKLALGLGLLGSAVGIGRAPLPDAIKQVHPEYGNTWGSGITYEVTHQKKPKPVDWVGNFTKGFRYAGDKSMPTEMKRAYNIGTNIVKSAQHKGYNTNGSSFTNGFIIGRHTGE